MTDTYKVTSKHVETTAEGRLLEPGDEIKSGKAFDPSKDENAALIEGGSLVKRPTAKTTQKKAPAKKASNNEKEGGD